MKNLGRVNGKRPKVRTRELRKCNEMKIRKKRRKLKIMWGNKIKERV
jgi:hypothetical protein